MFPGFCLHHVEDAVVLDNVGRHLGIDLVLLAHPLRPVVGGVLGVLGDHGHGVV